MWPEKTPIHPRRTGTKPPPPTLHPVLSTTPAGCDPVRAPNAAPFALQRIGRRHVSFHPVSASEGRDWGGPSATVRVYSPEADALKCSSLLLFTLSSNLLAGSRASASASVRRALRRSGGAEIFPGLEIGWGFFLFQFFFSFPAGEEGGSFGGGGGGGGGSGVSISDSERRAFEMEGGQYNPRTVEEVFRDFKGRRAGMIKALTTDVEEFYQQCDPEKENLCLYGFPNELWEVNLPAEEVPPELPEPALGINFARDGMQEKDWLSLVAVHSDAWLLSVAFYFGARFGFDKTDRKRLFSMINDLPTIFEVVTGSAKKQSKEKSSVSNSSNKSKSSSKGGRASESVKYSKPVQAKDEEEVVDEEDEEEHGDTLCGACGENYAADEFWICCDMCEKWFHGKCVKITPARAEHIKQYKCPSCSNKRARP
ncbi:hypothetical protein EUGRSUZ_C00844 [Eucalyptus grandis]|uniref:Uncharacterized protein n=3 Tax=Eucalyptus grandis TaxID=71139 RepID=A0ACC3LB01_EUCGR|nr:hypothetical protein EUGRSUZ_C00844 [Eucalyptus grandis]